MPVLVLNSSLQPLSVIPERRLIVLLSKQKVTFVDENVRQLIEESIQARRLDSERPVIVQLLANVRIPRLALQPTRANILLRDEDTCQYCGKRTRELTLDHVIPRSRGGQSTWLGDEQYGRGTEGREADLGEGRLGAVRGHDAPVVVCGFCWVEVGGWAGAWGGCGGCWAAGGGCWATC